MEFVSSKKETICCFFFLCDLRESVIVVDFSLHFSLTSQDQFNFQCVLLLALASSPETQNGSPNNVKFLFHATDCVQDTRTPDE